MPEAGLGLVVLNNEDVLSARLTAAIADAAYGSRWAKPMRPPPSPAASRACARMPAACARRSTSNARSSPHAPGAWARAAYAGRWHPLLGTLEVRLRDDASLAIDWGVLHAVASAYDEADACASSSCRARASGGVRGGRRSPDRAHVRRPALHPGRLSVTTGCRGRPRPEAAAVGGPNVATRSSNCRAARAGGNRASAGTRAWNGRERRCPPCLVQQHAGQVGMAASPFDRQRAQHWFCAALPRGRHTNHRGGCRRSSPSAPTARRTPAARPAKHGFAGFAPAGSGRRR